MMILMLPLWLAFGIESGSVELRGTQQAAGLILPSNTTPTLGPSHFSLTSAPAHQGRAKPPPVRLNTLPIPNRWVVDGESADSQFASHVAPAGDVNGDNLADIVICEPGFKNGRGRVLCFYGSTNGLAAKPNWITEGITGGLQLSGWAEGAGDVDHDGFADIVVVAYNPNASPVNQLPKREDCIFLFRGSPSGLLPEAQWNVTTKHLSVSAF